MKTSEAVSLLREHEFDLKEDMMTLVCVTCGAEGKKPRHRKGCRYVAFIHELEKGNNIQPG